MTLIKELNHNHSYDKLTGSACWSKRSIPTCAIWNLWDGRGGFQEPLRVPVSGFIEVRIQFSLKYNHKRADAVTQRAEKTTVFYLNWGQFLRTSHHHKRESSVFPSPPSTCRHGNSPVACQTCLRNVALLTSYLGRDSSPARTEIWPLSANNAKDSRNEVKSIKILQMT